MKSKVCKAMEQCIPKLGTSKKKAPWIRTDVAAKIKKKKQAQACKWQVKKLPENFSAQKLPHIVSRVCYKQNIY